MNSWHKLYSDGRDMVGLGPRGGTKKLIVVEVNINAVASVIQEDRHASVRLLERQLNIPKSIIHWILTEHLGMCRIASTWVSHFLTMEQMQQHVEACYENFAFIAEDPSVLSKIIRSMKAGYITSIRT